MGRENKKDLENIIERKKEEERGRDRKREE